MKTRREGQVVKSLQAARSTGPVAAGRIPSLTLKELVTAIHGSDIDEEVRAMALEPFINEVCRKLAEDGRVALFPMYAFIVQSLVHRSLTLTSGSTWSTIHTMV